MECRGKLKEINGNTFFNTLNNDDEVALGYYKTPFEIINTNGKSYRAFKKSSDGIEVSIVGSAQKYSKSKSKFKTDVNYFIGAIPGIFDLYKSAHDYYSNIMNKLLHNLVTINAHSIQEAYALLGDNKRVSKTIIKDTSEKISKNPEIAAKTLLEINKYNHWMKSEFSIFRKIYSEKKHLDFRYHILHKVFMNLCYIFFKDFTEKSIYVEVKESSLKAFIDYETFHAALFHILDNCTKYCMRNSYLIISFRDIDSNYILLSMEMTSLETTQLERDRVFEDKYSGSAAKYLKLEGSGSGMHLARKCIHKNNGYINFYASDKEPVRFEGSKYISHIIDIYLPKKPSCT